MLTQLALSLPSLLLPILLLLLQVINLKGHPTFVSDALSADMLWMIEHLSSLHADSRYTAVSAVGNRWSQLIASGKWVLQQDLFWAQPRPFWEVLCSNNLLL
jgi:hypothetical protein